MRALGRPAGVIQLLDRHGRDCAPVSARLGVPIWITPPTAIPGSPFEVVELKRSRLWRESALWWPGQRVLIVAEAVGTARYFRVPGEALGVHPLLRPALLGVEALTRHIDCSAQQGDRKLCGLSLDKPEPRHGRSISLAKKPRPLQNLALLPQHPVLPLELTQPGPLLARQHALTLTTISLVVLESVMQRLLRTAQISRQLPHRTRPATQHPQHLLPELWRVRRSRLSHHTRSSPEPLDSKASRCQPDRVNSILPA